MVEVEFEDNAFERSKLMKGLDTSASMHVKNAVTMSAGFLRTPPSIQLRGHIGGVRDLVVFETAGDEKESGAGGRSGSDSSSGTLFIVTVSTDGDMRVWSECHFNLIRDARGRVATVPLRPASP
jgi:hypothetical protein